MLPYNTLDMLHLTPVLLMTLPFFFCRRDALEAERKAAEEEAEAQREADKRERDEVCTILLTVIVTTYCTVVSTAVLAV